LALVLGGVDLDWLPGGVKSLELSGNVSDRSTVESGVDTLAQANPLQCRAVREGSVGTWKQGFGESRCDSDSSKAADCSECSEHAGDSEVLHVDVCMESDL